MNPVAPTAPLGHIHKFLPAMTVTHGENILPLLCSSHLTQPLWAFKENESLFPFNQSQGESRTCHYNTLQRYQSNMVPLTPHTKLPGHGPCSFVSARGTSTFVIRSKTGVKTMMARNGVDLAVRNIFCIGRIHLGTQLSTFMGVGGVAVRTTARRWCA